MTPRDEPPPAASSDTDGDDNDDDNDGGDNEAQRVAAAGELRRLLHAFVGHEVAGARLDALAEWARRTRGELDRGAHRDRMTLMLAARARSAPGDGDGDLLPVRRAGFEDRAVGGRANPTSVPFDAWRDGDTMLADITLGAAFEGAPGRAHGGIVAAVFDDFTGLVIGMLQQPAFTGELTVRFVRPVPVRTRLRFRTWLARRDGRKLFIEADAHDGDVLVATCKATYIAVDPSVFERAPDPR